MKNNKDCKQFFSDVIASIDNKRAEENLHLLTLEEKKVAWHVWQICWNQVRVQLRKEQKSIQKQRKQIEREIFPKKETFFGKLKTFIWLSR
jgi:hypothetical protein